MWTVAYHHNGMFMDYWGECLTFEAACDMAQELNKTGGHSCYVAIPWASTDAAISSY